MKDLGLTHVALEVSDMNRTLDFYARYAAMEIVHERTAESGGRVVWISDKTRPFVIVLIEVSAINAVLRPFAHLGVGCVSRDEVDRLCRLADSEGLSVEGPTDSGYPVGYWAFLRDPDGHTLEIAFGQEVGLTVESANFRSRR
jgi:catechol 2,3-dioxygenase-like lactoylglutathione lyase family enzyme